MSVIQIHQQWPYNQLSHESQVKTSQAKLERYFSVKPMIFS